MGRSISAKSYNLLVGLVLLFYLAAMIVVLEARAQTDQSVVAGKELSNRLGCFECHGENGIAANAEIPNMAGQDKSYLMRQLQSFSDPEFEERRDAVESARYHFGMEATTRRLNYDQRNLLATYFSSLKCIPAKTPDTANLPDVVKNCTRCHGLSGVNIEPGVPDLSGQKVVYLKQQLRAFRASRYGADPASEEEERYHDVMEEHAVSLSDGDIDTIAAYFSTFTCS